MELKGLTNKEVEDRVNRGLANTINTGHTKTIKEIFLIEHNGHYADNCRECYVQRMMDRIICKQ